MDNEYQYPLTRKPSRPRLVNKCRAVTLLVRPGLARWRQFNQVIISASTYEEIECSGRVEPFADVKVWAGQVVHIVAPAVEDSGCRIQTMIFGGFKTDWLFDWLGNPELNRLLNDIATKYSYSAIWSLAHRDATGLNIINVVWNVTLARLLMSTIYECMYLCMYVCIFWIILKAKLLDHSNQSKLYDLPLKRFPSDIRSTQHNQ